MPRGDGDCEHDSDCKGSLKCGQNNALERKFGDPYVRATLYMEDCDVCREAGDHDKTDGGLEEGEGDCDADSECKGSLECGTNNCVYFDGTNAGHSKYTRSDVTGTEFGEGKSHWINGKPGRWQPWYEKDDDCCYNPDNSLTAGDVEERLFKTRDGFHTISGATSGVQTSNAIVLDLEQNATALAAPEFSLEELVEEDIAEEGKWDTLSMICGPWEME